MNSGGEDFRDEGGRDPTRDMICPTPEPNQSGPFLWLGLTRQGARPCVIHSRMDAETLRCPSCGALVSNGSAQCSHCRGALATVACPKCLDLMFRDAKFCPGCGVPAFKWQPKPGNLQCPECAVPSLEGIGGSSVADPSRKAVLDLESCHE